MKMNDTRRGTSAGIWLLFTYMLLLSACAASDVTATIANPTPTPTRLPPDRQYGLSQEQILTLESLEIVDDHPLYIMHYYAEYEAGDLSPSMEWDTEYKPELHIISQDLKPDWGCSLFAALGDADHLLFGRNFDWQYSPAMLLFIHPKAGNASISMVDIEYLVGEQANHLHELPLDKRLPLLNAPHWPFDGMNDCGLVIGMAAVPYSGEYRADPQKTNIDSLKIMRKILDQACTVNEAAALMETYNIVWDGGPELHYMIADASGQAALVEFQPGSMTVLPNQEPWHQATNFLLSGSSGTPQGVCSRYDTITATMQAASGVLTPQQAMSLLSQVSQDNTQWSAVYDIKNGAIQVVMGKDYANPLTFRLDADP